MGKVVESPTLRGLYSLVVVVPLLFFLYSVGGLAESHGIDFPSDVMLPMIVCPVGYDVSGTVCCRVTHAAPILQCPRRWVLVDGMCICTEKTEGTLTCPHHHPDFTLDGGWCVRMEMTEPELVCPKGFVLSGNVCCREAVYPSTAICAERGFEVQGDICFRESKSAPGTVCPQGFYPSEHDGCVAYEEMAAELVCLPGYDLTPEGDGFCVRSVTSPPNLVCDEGWWMSTTGGMPHHHQHPHDPHHPHPHPHHPHAHPHLPRHRQSHSHSACSLPDSSCRHDEPPPAEDAECVKIHVAEATLVCEEGRGELRGHECVEDLSEEPELVCKTGFQLQNNRCVKVIEVDALLKCPEGFHLNPDETLCIAQDIYSPELVCEEGFELRHGRCEKIEKMEPNVVCDDWEQLVDGVCVSVLRVEAEKVCPPGYWMSDTGCKKAIHAPKELICAPGTELRGRYCLNYETGPVEHVCRGRGELSQGQQECVEIESKEPSLRCPPHYRLDAHLNKCTNEVMIAPEVVCAIGETLLTSKFGMCEREKVQPPMVRCPRGFSTVPIAVPWGVGEPQCSRVEERGIILRCEKGHKLVHRMCIPFRPRGKLSMKTMTKKWRKDKWTCGVEGASACP